MTADNGLGSVIVGVLIFVVVLAATLGTGGRKREEKEAEDSESPRAPRGGGDSAVLERREDALATLQGGTPPEHANPKRSKPAPELKPGLLAPRHALAWYQRPFTLWAVIGALTVRVFWLSAEVDEVRELAQVALVQSRSNYSAIQDHDSTLSDLRQRLR